VRDAKGLFWLKWHSHDLDYGVGAEVVSWLQSGLTVVLNGSRAYLPQAQAACDFFGIRLTPVWVVCDLSVLEARLRSRGRESEKEIKERLKQASAFLPPMDGVVINNSTTLDQALAQLLPLFKRALSI
jgi:ribose 1,5-bisphosphokinase